MKSLRVVHRVGSVSPPPGSGDLQRVGGEPASDRPATPGDPVFPRLHRTRLLDEVTLALRELIITNVLAPGTPLRQSDLAERLGVSRTPLREALRILEADGLVAVSNASRTVEVVSVSPSQLVEMYELRQAIDGLAARLAARNGMSPEAEAHASDLVDTMVKSRSPYDPAVRTDAHARLHSLFAEQSDNAYVASMAPMVRMSGAWLYHPFMAEEHTTAVVIDGQTRTLAESMARSDDFHRVILAAVVARRPDEAEDAARAHIANTLKGLRSIAEWPARQPIQISPDP